MAVENILRIIRKNHNDTQQNLADAIGVNARTIRNIEQSGTCNLEVALRLAKYYEMSVEHIFKFTD